MSDDRQTLAGCLFAAAAYLTWGFSPLYFRTVLSVPPAQILAHRIVWSLVLLLVIVALARRWSGVAACLRQRRTLLLLAGSTLLISGNWFTFIWAIEAHRVLEASLGYYINPLFLTLLGVAFLGERLGRWQWLAVLLAGLGVANLALQAGSFPWVSLVLAGSFGFYGLLRKLTPLGAADGLLLETALLAPVALGFLLWLGASGGGAWDSAGLGLNLLLMLSGPVTALPLVFFASAARRLSLTVVGFFQYFAPTVQFLLAVLVFGERFTQAHLVTFLCIWAAVVLFSATSWQRARRRRLLAQSVEEPV
ncbi:chloramphenicol-sensitive protein RarD [Tistlia consotensis]|uniref:Chloramphenicol-sensitive protein RarD n=1 Tax=Tistlia consotensis USBA 355 TaxID=560819 RepID=A0A1Y6C503_9PROT|nr:EamA family transporter RarD [Tistlia consotensis]SMF46050.1 chloramphenicol-sensitive protein RarD [Tistlia consotensis USBA 355]SNR78983.1 chloramphenicol-sensitive protein RarD [Tistlia consotensis]